MTLRSSTNQCSQLVVKDESVPGASSCKDGGGEKLAPHWVASPGHRHLAQGHTSRRHIVLHGDAHTTFHTVRQHLHQITKLLNYIIQILTVREVYIEFC